MSIHVTIKNDDSRDDAVIAVGVQGIDSDGSPGEFHSEAELAGGVAGTGGSVQLLVHGSQQIVVRELRQP